MYPSHDHIPTERPERRPLSRPRPRARRGLAVLAILGVLGVTVSAAAASSTAAASIAAESSAATPAPLPPISAPMGEHTLEKADVDAWLDGMLAAALENLDMTGAAVSVVYDGEILTSRGYGYADTGSTGGEAVPIDAEETLFRAASVSKLFTATAVMQLVESGDLDLDVDIAEYLDFTIPRNFDEPITLRHLLTHTPGFEERAGGAISPAGEAPDLRAALVTEPPEQIYAPGTVPGYSNYGNSLAGYIVERVSGVPFEEYVQRNIFEPTGMTSSTFVQPLPAELSDRMSNGYTTSSGAPAEFETVSTPPAGALTSSVPDMARFMLAQLGEAPSGKALLTPETLDLMHTPALEEGVPGSRVTWPRMGLGFFDESRNGHRIMGHGGDTNYFHSHLQIYPDDGAGIYVALNSSGSSDLASVQLREALTQGFADRYFPASTADEPPASGTTDEATAQEHAAMADGSYVTSRGMQSTFLAAIEPFSTVRVAAQPDGRLLITPGPVSDSPALYEEIEPWVWREVGGQRTVAMRVADGEVEAIAFEGAFALLRAQPERVPGVVYPVLGVSLVILVVTAVAWPVGAIVRRMRHRTLREGTGRVTRVLRNIAVVCILVALGGWTTTVLSAMSLQDTPAATLRGFQALQAIGVLGLVPAVMQVVGAVKHQHGWRRVTGTVLVVLALAGMAWFAFEFRLIAPSVSY